jgi:two-component system, OmpR family, KDP operon response regulator KdpE
MASDRPLVYIIEDEPGIRRFLRASLEQEGYRLVEAVTGRQALTMIRSRPPDVIILDLGLPDIDGMEIIDFVRSWSKLPIVVLSARTKDRDKVEALDRGADDYLTKPFSVSELHARLRVALRHSAMMASPDGQETFETGPLRVELATRHVYVSGEEVHLTPVEYRLLETLIANAGRVLTHRYLREEVWGPYRAGSVHHLRVHMGNLRRKIESDPARPQLLRTEQGIGYRMSLED